jgi:serine/threonine protein kinase
MEHNFFQDFRDKFEKLNCLRPPSKAVGHLDLHNFSAIFDNVETLISRDQSYTSEDNPLSQTMPVPKISLETSGGSDYKLIVESVKTNNPLLFKKYMNLNMNLLQVNSKKRNFLHTAAKHGSLEISQLILAYTQIPVNSRDEDLRSPLHLATLHGHAMMAQYLYRCGGYLHVKDRMGNTAIDYAIESKNVELIKFFFDKSPSLCKNFGFNVFELLKNQGISIDVKRNKQSDDKSKVRKLEEPFDPANISDFTFIRELGKGSFGHVYLVQQAETGEKYAMKIITKEKVYKDGLEDYLLTEKEVMKQVDSDFIVKLHFSFQTSSFFCLVMDYCPCGTLADILSKERCLPEVKAKKYLVEVLVALEALHKNNILYRDLKPENILIDEAGHIKITDFGLAKQGISDEKSAESFCGTVSYIAPEVIEKKGYGKAADWYAFGVLMFEMLTGTVPKANPKKNFVVDQNGSSKIRVPAYVSNNARLLIEGLLVNDFRNRIGFRGTEQVKRHEFFSDVDWNVVERKELRMDVIRKRNPDESPQDCVLPEAPEMKDMDGWSFVMKN